MSIQIIVTKSESSWTKTDGPCSPVVISSRIRLARNIAKLPLPLYQTETTGHTVIERVKAAITESEQFFDSKKLLMYRMNELPALERQILVEKHLISPEHVESVENKALVISEDEQISIMVNEEDHFRIQCLLPGLQLIEAWKMADRIDDYFEEKLEFAYCEKKGYLTACPTNVGSGLRASVMLHLPGLVLTKQLGKIFNTLAQLGLTVRGLYGEGTEALGNIFQISNQITLGLSEKEIIENISSVIKQLVEQELNARKALLKDALIYIEDRVGRAFGILSNARILSSEEALSLLSDLRLGMDTKLLQFSQGPNTNELMVLSQPAFLQRFTGKELSPLQRDINRAMLLREKINMNLEV